MPVNDPKLKDMLARLSGWAEKLVAGLTPAEQEQAWLASMALLRRTRVDPFSEASPLPVESSFEAAIERLRASKAGDEDASRTFERLVREGYLAAREESLASFTSDMDQPTRLAVTALACFSHHAHGQPPQEAVMEALRVAYDRDHEPDEALLRRSTHMLATALEEVEGSTVLRHALIKFVSGNMGSLGGLLG
jgi:tRNA U55 pseudouridine synthase TruB